MEGCQLNNELPLGNAPTPLNLDDEDSREALERSEADMEEDGEFEYEAPDSPAPYLDDPSKSTEWGLLYSQLNSMALATSTTTFESQKCLASDLQDVFITTGCPNIDAFLNGGVIQSGMTEITGPGGSGKTQLALQLCITCQLPEHLGGLNKDSIYVFTSNPFPSPRLVQLCKSFKTKYGKELPDKPMDHIHVRPAFDTDLLLKCVTTEIPELLRTKKIGVLVLDSIATTFRTEYDNDIPARVHDLRIMGRALQDIAFKHNLILVCVNQVSAAMGPDDIQEFAPALGMTWRNIVNHRIVLSRKDGGGRSMDVAFSSYIPVRGIAFEITTDRVTSSDPRWTLSKKQEEQ